MQIYYNSNNYLTNRISIEEHLNHISIQITIISSYTLADLIFGLLKFTGDALIKVKDGLNKAWDGIKDGLQYITHSAVAIVFNSLVAVIRNIFVTIFQSVSSTLNGYSTYSVTNGIGFSSSIDANNIDIIVNFRDAKYMEILIGDIDLTVNLYNLLFGFDTLGIAEDKAELSTLLFSGAYALLFTSLVSAAYMDEASAAGGIGGLITVFITTITAGSAMAAWITAIITMFAVRLAMNQEEKNTYDHYMLGAHSAIYFIAGFAALLEQFDNIMYTIKSGKGLDKINAQLTLIGMTLPFMITGYNNIKDITTNMMLSLAVFIASDLVANYALLNPANKMFEKLYTFFNGFIIVVHTILWGVFTKLSEE